MFSFSFVPLKMNPLSMVIIEHNRGDEIIYVATIKNDTDSTKKETSHFFASSN